MTPRVSVVMSVYNGQQYLESAMDSVLRQSFGDFEVVVIDDGSTDRSGAMLEAYAQKDDRVQVVHGGVNRGLILALNDGVARARGEFIARMDPDDLCLPERFAEQVKYLDAHPEVVALGTTVELIDPEGWPIRHFSELVDHDDIDREHMKGLGGIICHPSVMMRSEIVREVGAYRTQVPHAEDLDLFLRLGERGKLANLSQVGLQYRMHPQSIGHTKREKQRESAAWAVADARRRRSPESADEASAPPVQDQVENEPSSSSMRERRSKMHRKWAWWALSAGNLATARKHAKKALALEPAHKDNWHVAVTVARDSLRARLIQGRP